MKFDLDSILPLVTKPIRYTGGELNSVPARTDRKVKVVLALPDVYEIGMSNYGLRILYSLLNRRADTVAERAYTPWPDLAERLQASGTPLYSLESRRPLAEFDIVGLSLQSELAGTNVLYTLDLGGIPLRSAERTAKDPLVIAGGPCTTNPGPMSPFIDCFTIGDGEDVLGEIVDVYRDWNHVSRDDLLTALAGLEGVYVPLKHDGRVVRRRFVTRLTEEGFPLPPIVPTCEIVHDRLTLEIARGCTRGCRFCQAGMISRPYRVRPVDEIVRLAEQGIRQSGWEEVSLLSLSSLDYPNLLELVSRLNESLEKRRVAVSLPSVRGEDFTPELAQALKLVHKSGLTFAPETATPRLRALVNKDISEEKILNSVRTAVEAGWMGVKLYFMVGLPGETVADVAEIRRFVEEVGRVGRRAQIRFNLSPFVPKPHTPLQWAGFDDLAALHEKISSVKAGLRRNIKAKWETPEVSCLQAILARGDARLAAVIEQVYRAGGVFQDWTEKFNFERWQQAFDAAGLSMADYLKPMPVEQPLSWDFIDAGVSREFLKQEFARAQTGEFTPDCRLEGCTDCGIADCPIRDLGVVPEMPVAPVAHPDGVFTAPMPDYGRYPRKIIGSEPLKLKFRLKYAVGEDFRYAGHLDIVRAFYRAMRRSELPVAYSQGFAPRPVVAFGPPKPVGLISAGEYVDFQMAGHYPGNLVRDLGPFMPRGLRLLEGRPIPPKATSLAAGLNVARYRIQTRGLSDADRDAARARQGAVNGVFELHYAAAERNAAGVEDFPGDPVEVQLTLSLAAGVKLFPALQQLFDRDDPSVRCWRIQRLGCYVAQPGDKLLSPMEEV